MITDYTVEPVELKSTSDKGALLLISDTGGGLQSV